MTRAEGVRSNARVDPTRVALACGASAGLLLIALSVSAFFVKSSYRASVARHVAAESEMLILSRIRHDIAATRLVLRGHESNGASGRIAALGNTRRAVAARLAELRRKSSSRTAAAAGELAEAATQYFEAAARQVDAWATAQASRNAVPRTLTMDRAVEQRPRTALAALDRAQREQRSETAAALARWHRLDDGLTLVFTPIAVLLLVVSFAVLLWERRARQHAEGRLERVVESLQIAFALLPVPVVGRVHDGRVVMWNEAAERSFGWSDAEARGRRLQLECDETLDGLLGARGGVWAGETVGSLELTALRRDGSTFPALVSIAPLRDARGEITGSLTVYEDVTRMRHSEEMRVTRLYRQRDSIVREVHHAVKNGLQGLIALLREELAAQTSLDSLLKRVITHVQAVAALHGLRSRTGHDLVPVSELVREVGISVALTQGRELALILQPEADSFVLREADAVPLALIFGELMTNAIKHNRPSGVSPPTASLRACGDELIFEARNEGELRSAANAETEGRGSGSGLALVRAMLPSGNAAGFSLCAEQGSVVAILHLRTPVIARASGCNARPAASAA